MKRAENFQGLETNFGKLPVVYFMKPPAAMCFLGVWECHAPDICENTRKLVKK